MCKSTVSQNSKPQETSQNNNDNFVYSQLHEQFAENYNSISNYVIALMVGLVTVLTCYGITCRDLFVSDPESRLEPWYAPLILFLGSNVLVVGFFLIVSYLSIKQGWAIRRDQFIINAIRTNLLGKEKMLAINGGIFSIQYNPFKKNIEKKNNILVGTFKYLYQISLYSIISFLSFSLIVLLVYLLRKPEINISGITHITFSDFIINFPSKEEFQYILDINLHNLTSCKISTNSVLFYSSLIIYILMLSIYFICTHYWLVKVNNEYQKYEIEYNLHYKYF